MWYEDHVEHILPIRPLQAQDRAQWSFSVCIFRFFHSQEIDVHVIKRVRVLWVFESWPLAIVCAKTWFHIGKHTNLWKFAAIWLDQTQVLIFNSGGSQYLRFQKWHICINLPRTHVSSTRFFPSKTSRVRRAIYNQSVIFFVPVNNGDARLASTHACGCALFWKIVKCQDRVVSTSVGHFLGFTQFCVFLNVRGFGTRRCVLGLRAATLYSSDMAME